MLSQRSKYSNLYKGAFLTFFACVLFVSFTFLTSCQIYTKDKSYVSDITKHIQFSIQGTGYSVVYKTMGFLYQVTDSLFPIALLEGLMMVATWLLSAKYICSVHNKFSFTKAAVVSFPILFIAGIYIPGVYEHFYLRQIVTQPHHNITYIAMRMFAVAAMFAFSKIFDLYLYQMNWKGWVALAVMLAFSTASKPSFFYGFALALLLFLIIDFLCKKFQVKTFIRIIIMGVVAFPSLFIMALQAVKLYGKSVDDGGSGLALIWGANFIKHGLTNTMLKVLCGLLFPAIVTFVNRKNLTRNEKFVCVMYVVHFALCVLLTETGKRANDGNFFWGLYSSAFFLFLSTAARFFENVIYSRKKNVLYYFVCTILLSAHVLTGVIYFISLLQGGHYLK